MSVGEQMLVRALKPPAPQATVPMAAHSQLEALQYSLVGQTLVGAQMLSEELNPPEPQASGVMGLQAQSFVSQTNPPVHVSVGEQ